MDQDARTKAAQMEGKGACVLPPSQETHHRAIEVSRRRCCRAVSLCRTCLAPEIEADCLESDGPHNRPNCPRRAIKGSLDSSGPGMRAPTAAAHERVGGECAATGKNRQTQGEFRNTLRISRAGVYDRNST